MGNKGEISVYGDESFNGRLPRRLKLIPYFYVGIDSILASMKLDRDTDRRRRYCAGGG